MVLYSFFFGFLAAFFNFVLKARVEHLCALRTDRQRQALLQGVDEHIVAQDMSLHREHKGVSAALQSLKKVSENSYLCKLNN